jgi:hypothetical protein
LSSVNQWHACTSLLLAFPLTPNNHFSLYFPLDDNDLWMVETGEDEIKKVYTEIWVLISDCRSLVICD